MRIQPTQYQVGWQLAQRASQRVAFVSTQHLDGDAYRRFVGHTIEQAISDGDDRGATESYLAGLRDGAAAAWEQRFERGPA